MNLKVIKLKVLKKSVIMLLLLLLVACGNNYDSIIDLSIEEFKEELSETTMGASILRHYDSDYEFRNDLEMIIWKDDGYVKMSIPATENRNLDKYYKIEGKDLKRVNDDDFEDLKEPNYHEKKGEIIEE